MFGDLRQSHGVTDLIIRYNPPFEAFSPDSSEELTGFLNVIYQLVGDQIATIRTLDQPNQDDLTLQAIIHHPDWPAAMQIVESEPDGVYQPLTSLTTPETLKHPPIPIQLPFPRERYAANSTPTLVLPRDV